MAAKSPVIAAVERNGEIRAEVTPDTKSATIGKFLHEKVDPKNTRLMTDDSNRYDRVAKGYYRSMVNHGLKVYAYQDVHVNHVESFWAHVKRSMKGTHKVISKQHLQGYLDAFVFHYNNRHSDRDRFEVLLGTLLLSSR